MLVCFNKESGLALLRHARATGAIAHAEICGLPEPDPSPQRRWTRKVIPHELLGMADPPTSSNPVHIASPAAELRPQASFIECTTHSAGLPAGACLRLGESLVIPSPELLFVELAEVMHPAALELLGYELCGTYARDPNDPRCGSVVHGLQPVTSVSSIRAFIDSCQRIHGRRPALRALHNVCDGAWSAMESICVLFMRRPASELGYELGELRLNERQDSPRDLTSRGCPLSRVPDILLADHPVGFNYDGRDHLDLRAIPPLAEQPDDLARKLAEIRDRYVDDRRRDRELAAQGMVVMPVVSEDLFSPGGLDLVVMEALMASERLGGPPRASSSPKEAWEQENVLARGRLLMSLLPWRGGTSLGVY